MDLSTKNAVYVIAAYAVGYLAIQGLALNLILQRFRLRRLLAQNSGKTQ